MLIYQDLAEILTIRSQEAYKQIIDMNKSQKYVRTIFDTLFIQK